MEGITVILKHEHGEDELFLDKEIVNMISIEAAKENITFEQKFNNMLKDQMEKENDEKSDTTKDY